MTVELETAGLVAGDTAGLALLGSPYTWIGVVRSNEGTTLQMITNPAGGRRRTGAPIEPANPPTIRRTFSVALIWNHATKRR